MERYCVPLSGPCLSMAVGSMLAKNAFTNGDVRWTRHADTTNLIADVTANLHAKLPLGVTGAFPMQLYFVPNDYKILRGQPVPEMDKIINLGRDMYAFVRPINKYIVMPVFNFFRGLSAAWVL